ncbi:hypothetical protein ACFV23_13935, partial [Streptomyces sp. NPDC059627]
MGEHREGGAGFERVEQMEERTEAAVAAAAPSYKSMNAFTPADEERQRGVRRMKRTATGLLLVVAVVYALAKLASGAGAGACAD